MPYVPQVLRLSARALVVATAVLLLAPVTGRTAAPTPTAAVAHALAAATSSTSGAAVTMARTPDGGGYWVASSSGSVFNFGDARSFGSLGSGTHSAPVAAMAATPDGGGYWLATADGGVFGFGDARSFGSLSGRALNAPIVGMASTPDGGGYWLVASDGGIFTFGDAAFHGSAGALRLREPVVGMAATPDGGGYWLAAADGGIFTFGDAAFHGSAGALRLREPVVGMAATPDGGGYWLAAADGGIFTFGDAPFEGSLGAIQLNQPIVAMATTPKVGGYWLAAADGGIFTLGRASFYGSATSDINPLLVDQLATTDGAQQMIVVDAPSVSSTTATLYTFENDGAGWRQVFGPMPAVDGTTGWVPGGDRHEGDGAAPEGIYPIGSTMYGTDPDPGTLFPYHQLVCGDWWDEDSASPGYNTFQHVACGTTPPFAASSEALWTEGNAYPSMAVIDFNTPPTGPLGSGIFLHANIGAPTQGCVSLPLADLVMVLKWLNPALHPAIAMGADSVIRTF